MTPEFLAQSTNTKVELPRPVVNSQERYIVVPQYNDKTSPSPLGEPGSYRVTYLLTIPGTSLYYTTLDSDAIMQSGDSLLTVPPNVSELRFDFSTELGQRYVRAKVNASHRLATMELEFDAANLRDAEIAAWNTTMPLMSTLAFIYNVPVEFSGYEALELKTSVRVYAFGIVGQEQPFDSSRPLGYAADLAPAMSAFREGLGSTSPFYQFLSFYRVLESIHHIRTKRGRKLSVAERRSQDETFPMPELVNGEQLEGVIKKVAGKRFKAIKEQMRPVLRNALAHMNPSQVTKIVDRYEDYEEVLEWLPVVRYMAKQVLENERALYFG